MEQFIKHIEKHSNWFTQNQQYKHSNSYYFKCPFQAET